MTSTAEEISELPFATSFSPSEREAFLSEVRSYLPAFLSAATSEQEDPLGDVSELLSLTRADLERVIAVHIILSPPIQAFREALPRALRNPISASLRPLIATQAVRGPIDWGATIRYRSTTGWAPNVFIVRPAERRFDTPENRALMWLLHQLDVELRKVGPARRDEAGGIHNKTWLGKILSTKEELGRAQTFHWLRGIPPEYPTNRTRQRLTAQRSDFYSNLVPEAIGILRQVTESPSPKDITDLLCQRYFEPERDWKLFELVVCLRLARAFADVSTRKRRTRLLVGTGRAPFARYELEDGSEVRLWYQTWPTDAGPSFHSLSRQQYRIEAGPVRPDVVIERLANDEVKDAAVLELKATRSGSYLGQGLFQLLGYLNDCPGLFSRQPSGWLVAPSSPAFETWEAQDLSLWVVDSDSVALAAVQRFTSASI